MAFSHTLGVPGTPCVPDVPVVSGPSARQGSSWLSKHAISLNRLADFASQSTERAWRISWQRIAMLPGRDGQSHHMRGFVIATHPRRIIRTLRKYVLVWGSWQNYSLQILYGRTLRLHTSFQMMQSATFSVPFQGIDHPTQAHETRPP